MPGNNAADENAQSLEEKMEESTVDGDEQGSSIVNADMNEAQDDNVDETNKVPDNLNPPADRLKIEILRRKNIAQAEQIENLHRELNASRIKHGEEAYWLRLELDSSRREKEAVEDRMSELYHDLQGILGASSPEESVGVGPSNKNAKDVSSVDICTEPDYVMALLDRLTAYERSVDILNRQIAMLKTSSDAVVTSMKQEVTDLMEEKSFMEMDLLNQISNLHVIKGDLEVELSARLAAGTENVNLHESLLSEASARADMELERSTFSSVSSCPHALTPDKDQSETEILDESNLFPYGDKIPSKETGQLTPAKESRDSSFQSTATTLGSSFTNEATLHTSMLSVITQTGPESPREVSRISELLGELARQKAAIENSKTEKLILEEKLDEITKELMFTRSSANVALTLDKIETDRAETLAHLDRISVLWDRADGTIEVLEALLSELQPKGVNQENNNSDAARKVDRERLLSTLETVTLVHGQIKMSLMHIELAFRNHLACIQNGNPTPLDKDSDRIEKIRSETLSTISKMEATWTSTVEQLEKQILADRKSACDSIQKQVGELQKAKLVHQSLEQELSLLKQQQQQQQQQPFAAKDVAPAHDAHLVGKAEFVEPSLSSSVEPLNQTAITVSRGVLLRLQKEIFLAVQRMQEKNELIGRLSKTVERHRLREEVLKKELKRARQKAHSSKSKKKDSNDDPAKLNLKAVSAIKSISKQEDRSQSRSKDKNNSSSPGPSETVQLPASNSTWGELDNGERRDRPAPPERRPRSKMFALVHNPRGWSSL